MDFPLVPKLVILSDLGPHNGSFFYFQTWIQDLLIRDQNQDLAVSRPRPRLWCPRPRAIETQDLQDQYWKSMTGMDCDKQKDWKVMASRKSSTPVVAHSKQQNIIPCLTTVLFPQLPFIIAVYQTFANTRNISKVWCLINN